LLFTVPVLFKKQIKSKVETVINESVNATVKFEDYKLSFFRNFPNLSFSLKKMYVVGVNKFEGFRLLGNLLYQDQQKAFTVTLTVHYRM
jgi:AsmA protein